ncbi:MAG: hypothetical protein IPP80_09660 [Ignavibacteria bacterium]|nr:hypothetical protein [Ignavibacteria bacterium]
MMVLRWRDTNRLLLSLHTDMTDQAISWVRYQQALFPDKPFFLYYAPGATTRRITVQRNGPTNTRQIRSGRDVIREQTLARQIKSGIVPANTKLAPKPADIKDWNKLSADEKKLFTRQMSVYAGFAEHTGL